MEVLAAMEYIPTVLLPAFLLMGIGDQPMSTQWCALRHDSMELCAVPKAFPDRRWGLSCLVGDGSDECVEWRGPCMEGLCMDPDASLFDRSDQGEQPSGGGCGKYTE